MSLVLVDGNPSVRPADAPIAELARDVDGVFTTARVEGGVIVRRDLHRERLLDEGPDAPLVERALSEADELAAQLGDGMVRVAVGRKLDKLRRVVAAAPARRPPWKAQHAPIRIGVAVDPRTLPVTKQIEREALDRLDALSRRLGMDGAVLIGPEGVREGTWFHLAIRRGERWVTPPRSPMVSFGTTRTTFLERDDAEEGAISLDELLNADEIRVMSALLGVAVARVRADLIVPRGIEVSID
jgi:branched-subunit amino acid aminotransferase/4-amino-4-deoxychorismate lyase